MRAPLFGRRECAAVVERAKELAKSPQERARCRAAVARLGTEYGDGLAVLSTRYRVVRGREVRGPGRARRFEMPRPTDSDKPSPPQPSPPTGAPTSCSRGRSSWSSSERALDTGQWPAAHRPRRPPDRRLRPDLDQGAQARSDPLRRRD
ncbi:DUF5954 family protein [Streptomyces aureus]|uniref:DUF5954 family protein n=1 Tax=Streptomyces aureus TaxID=193461 RepID=UPI0034656422